MEFVKKNARLFFLLAGLIFLIISAYFIIDYFSLKSLAERKSVAEARRQIDSAAKSIDGKLAEIMSQARALVNDIENGELDSLALLERLEKVVRDDEDVFGFGVGYQPYQYSKKRRLYAPFYIRPGGAPKLTFVDTSYDYTERPWYAVPRDSGAAWFEPPYYGIVAKSLIAEYSVPIYREGEDKAIGLAYIDLSLEGLTDVVNRISVGKSGYGFMLSRSGNYISHPMVDWVKSEKNVRDFAGEFRDGRIVEFFERGVYDGKEYLDIKNPINGLSSRLMVQVLETTGWRLAAMFISRDFTSDYQTLMRKVIFFLIYFTLALACFALFYLLSVPFSEIKIWAISGAISAAFATAIWIIWSMSLAKPIHAYGGENSTIIGDRSSLKKFLRDENENRTKLKEAPARVVPTGIYVESMEIRGANQVNIGGVIWQTLDSAANADVPIFAFPEAAPDAEGIYIEKIYEKRSGDKKTVGWRIRVALKQEIKFAYYPFDRQLLHVRMRPPEFEGDIALAPDLKSYALTNPAMKPGVEPEVFLRGWELIGSFFSFDSKIYNTTFGARNSFSNRRRAELNFNIIAGRRFIGPFINHVAPLFVISALLFTVVTAGANLDEDSKLGFTGFGALEICAAFYFVVIISHLDFRNFLGAVDIIYLDYFYFVVYLKILVYAVNSILFSRYKKIELIQYRRNLIPRLLFWPMYLFLMFAITCSVFY